VEVLPTAPGYSLIEWNLRANAEKVAFIVIFPSHIGNCRPDPRQEIRIPGFRIEVVAGSETQPNLRPAQRPVWVLLRRADV
jgi:hypothetical protein